MGEYYKGTDAQKEGVKRYQAKRDAIMLRPSKEDGAKIRAAAAAAGKPVQRFILEALADKVSELGEM